MLVMLDVKKIRNNFDEIAKLLEHRGVDKSKLTEFMELDQTRRTLIPQVEEKKKQRNLLSEEVAKLKRNNEDITKHVKNTKQLAQEIKDLEQQ